MPSFGLIFFPLTAASVVGTAKLADELGYRLLGLIDSHALAMDVYVALTLAATSSSNILIGPCVTNPITRDLSVTAAAAASLDVVSGRRAFLGISRGFSGAKSVGLGPGATSSMLDVVLRLRALMSGELVEADGRQMRLAWSKRAVPIMMAASGPKALEIAGRAADAVLVHVGISPEIVSKAVARIRDGAKEAGRDPNAVEIWVHGAAACSPDGKAARDSLKGTVAGMGAAVFTPNTAGKDLPPELEKPIAELRREYRVTQHMQRNDDQNERLIERLGLTEYLLNRFAFAGTPDDIREKVRALERIGVSRFIFNLSTSSKVDADAHALAVALRISTRAQ